MRIRVLHSWIGRIQEEVLNADESDSSIEEFLVWMVLELGIAIIIFVCAQIGLWSAGWVADPGTGSGLVADYGPWDRLNFHTFRSGIIEEIHQANPGIESEGKLVSTPEPADEVVWMGEPVESPAPSAPGGAGDVPPDSTQMPGPDPDPSYVVDTPLISPDGGSFTEPVVVTLSCNTVGATIRYTTDGSDPTINSSMYNEPFILTSSATVKAQAFKDGMQDSGVASAMLTVTIDGGSYVDLVAASLSWVPNPVQEGDDLSITFVVRNDGNVAARSFHIQLTLNGASLCDWDVSNLGAGQVFERTCSGSYSIPSTSPPGHTIELIVDDRNEVAESNEGNNTKSAYVSVQTDSSSVDLVPGYITWSPNPVNQGDGVSITFTVRNDGSSGAGGFHVQLSSDGKKICDWMVTSLGAGEVFQRTCPASDGIPSASSPGHTIGLTVDDRGEIGESNEANNSTSVYIPVESIAYFVDLVPGAITWSPDPTYNGDGVSITFTVRNDGNSGAGRFHIQLLRDGTNMCDWDVGSLGAGEVIQRTCPVSHGIPSASQPGHSIEIRVDDRSEVAESSEGNNSKTIYIPVL